MRSRRGRVRSRSRGNGTRRLAPGSGWVRACGPAASVSCAAAEAAGGTTACPCAGKSIASPVQGDGRWKTSTKLAHQPCGMISSLLARTPTVSSDSLWRTKGRRLSSNVGPASCIELREVALGHLAIPPFRPMMIVRPSREARWLSGLAGQPAGWIKPPSSLPARALI